MPDSYLTQSDAAILRLPEVPSPFLSLIVRPPRTRATSNCQIDPELGAELLSLLNPANYREYGDWIRVLIAFKAATGEGGREYFIEWSQGDPKYAGDGRIEVHWDSVDREGDIKIGTLLHEIGEAAMDMSPEKAEEARRLIDRVRAVATFNEGDWGPEWDVDREADPEAPELTVESADKAEVKTPAFARPENLLALSDRLARDIPPIDWLVRGIAVEGEPMILGGPQKTLKTSIALALAIALATATKFLGVFDVPKRRKVLFLCGESGERTTVRNAKHMLDAADLAPSALDNLTMGFDLPALGNSKHRSALRKLLTDRGIEVVIIDPAYLCLMAGSAREINAGSVFDMGLLLRNINAVCKSAGATLILLHHTKKANRHDRNLPTELDDLSQAGFREFARQWLLLSRRENYGYEGIHKLRLDVGGSAGHSGCYAVDIETGRLPDPLANRQAAVCFDDDPDDVGSESEEPDGGKDGLLSDGSGGLTWKVDVQSYQRFVEGEKERKASAKTAEDQAKCDRVVEFLQLHPEGETRNQIKSAAKIGVDVCSRIIDQLIGDGVVETVTLKKGCGRPDGFRLTPIPGGEG